MQEIRNEQLERLNERRTQDLASKVCTYLVRQFPDATVVDKNIMQEEVIKQIGNAKAYGLVIEKHVITYVISAWLLGERFDKEFPPAKITLTAVDFSAERKAKWLKDWTIQIFKDLEKGK